MTRKPLLVLGLLSLLSILFTACGPADPLDSTTWRLESYGKAVPLDDWNFTATFEDGEVSGNALCNFYAATYEVRGNRITFDYLMITEEECTRQESDIIDYFYEAERFELEDDQLRIYRADGDALIFVPQ
jgi:heat shock protein HslJ